jgi:hypothetical protein
LPTAIRATPDEPRTITQRAIPAPLKQRSRTMAKGEQRGNREAKKPKKDKPKAAAAAPATFAAVVAKAAGPKKK